jgi:hypothetical protein
MKYALRFFAVLATLALAMLGATAASASASHPVPKTIGCAVNPFCFDIYNTQLGPNDTFKVVGSPVVGAKIILGARNGQSGAEDSLYIPVGNVSTTLNCADPQCNNSINWPFVDPQADLQFIEFGDTQVFSQQDAPNGHLKQVYFGLNSLNKLSLEPAGVYGSQTYQNRLWVVSPFFQFNDSSPVINVGQTNKTGTFKVLAIPDGALAGIQPRIQTGQLDSLGQAPENQTWNTEPNYP